MDNAEKAAIKAGSATAILGSVAAALLANPVCWAAVLYGTYRVGKAAYRQAKYNAEAKARREDPDLPIF